MARSALSSQDVWNAVHVERSARRKGSQAGLILALRSESVFVRANPVIAIYVKGYVITMAAAAATFRLNTISTYDDLIDELLALVPQVVSCASDDDHLVYVSQRIDFRVPFITGDTLNVEATSIEQIAKRFVRVNIVATKQTGDIVMNLETLIQGCLKDMQITYPLAYCRQWLAVSEPDSVGDVAGT